MADVVSIRKQESAAPSESYSDQRAEQFAATIKHLFGELPLPDKQLVLSEITEILRPIPSPRAGDVLGAVIYLLSTRREWSVQQLMKWLDDSGIEHKAKDVYNALGYLNRKHKIQRTGHGRYSINGMPVVTSDELGGAPSKDEQFDAN